MRYVPANGACSLFPTNSAAGPKRNFQVLGPLEFLAEFTQHIPAKGAQLIRDYGWYSNKFRGMRRRAAMRAATKAWGLPPPIVATGCSQTWAMLIKRIYEVDLLACPKCGGTNYRLAPRCAKSNLDPQDPPPELPTRFCPLKSVPAPFPAPLLEKRWAPSAPFR